ncbi:phage holin [Marinomonas sp. 2405UD68-3]|uniref:phage holin n=1 Tax=Marinomonas sp. 2405UD68-3 TaxID=3391835 RepID=UPI0039C8E6AA
MDRVTVTTYSSSFVAFFGGITINDAAAVGGLVIGVATFAVNFWFKRQHLQIAKREKEKGAN